MDLIDRQALKAEIKKWLNPLPYITENKMVDLDDIAVSVIMTIEEAPTVEPKRGEWERHPDFLHISSANVHRCSMCKERPLYKMGYEVLSAYCPNCGADMRGDAND